MALLLPSLQGGGVQRALVNLAGGLEQRGLALDFVVGSADGPFRALLPAGARMVELGAEKMLPALPALAGYLRRERPRLLLSAQLHVNLVAVLARALAGTRTSLVLSEHNDVRAVFRRAPSLKWRLTPLLAPLLYPFADRIVAVSDGVARGLAGWLHVPPQRIRVIYNPLVDARVLEAAQRPAAHPWLAAPRAAGDAPLLLAVGRLEPQKDYPTLLRALARLRETSAGSAARLVILGEGSQRAALTALAAGLGLGESLSLPGYADDPFACMARADVFVLSSAWEGLPGVLVEAMACGCRLVSTDCPSGPAEILEGGKWGALTPVGDAEALAQAIARGLAAQPPAGQRQAAVARFGVEQAAQRYLELFDELAGV